MRTQNAQVIKPNRRTTALLLLVLLGGFGLAAALLLWLDAATANSMGLSLPNKLQDLITLTLSMVVEAMPFVILGASISAIIRLFASAQRLTKLLPKRPLLRRLSISLLGTFMPVCECGNVPVARGLVIQGLSVAESMTFLLAAPVINPVTFIWSGASSLSIRTRRSWSARASMRPYVRWKHPMATTMTVTT
jgi:uncharacterized membrane protein YraQ (UPF0718 family)